MYPDTWRAPSGRAAPRREALRAALNAIFSTEYEFVQKCAGFS